MTRVALLSVALLAVAANAASFHTHYHRQTNSFQNLPDVRTFGFCLTECTAVGQAQASQAFGNSSTACTATLASQIGNCMQCLGSSPLTALLNNDIKQQIQDAKTNYESQCAAASSPITIDIGTAFRTGSSSASTSASTTATASATPLTQAPASTSAPTATPSSTGPASTTVSLGHVHAPSFGIAVAVVIAVFAAI